MICNFTKRRRIHIVQLAEKFAMNSKFSLTHFGIICESFIINQKQYYGLMSYSSGNDLVQKSLVFFREKKSLKICLAIFPTNTEGLKIYAQN